MGNDDDGLGGVPSPQFRPARQSANSVAAGQELGGYFLQELLGSGGMGRVFRAVDADGNDVALKVLHPHLAADDDARRRLRREVSALQRVRHPRVARVLDAEVDQDIAFVVTELIAGVTLTRSVRDEGPFEPGELAHFAEVLAEALTAVHEAGVIHRDLKPSNVMITDDGPVLIDFGIAQVGDDERVTATGLVIGTPGYLAPEVLSGTPPTTAVDWFAWAAVVLFAATGRPPFGRGPLSAVVARMASGQCDVAGLDVGQVAAFKAALHPDPVVRAPVFETVQQLFVPDAVLGGTAVLPSGGGEGGAAAGFDRATSVTQRVAPPTSGAPRAGGEPTAVLPPTAAQPYAPDPTVPYGTAPGTGAQSPAAPYASPAAPYASPASPYVPPASPYAPPPPAPAQPPGTPFPLGPGNLAAPARARATLFALAVLLIAAATWAPVISLFITVVLFTTARTAGLARAARLARGRRIGALAVPWYVIRAAVGGLPQLALGLLLGAMAGAVAMLASIIANDTARGNGSKPIFAAVAAALISTLLIAVVWSWDKAGRRRPESAGDGPTRVGARVIVTKLLPRRDVRALLIIAMLAAAAVLVIAAIASGGPTWVPFGGAFP